VAQSDWLMWQLSHLYWAYLPKTTHHTFTVEETSTSANKIYRVTGLVRWPYIFQKANTGPLLKNALVNAKS